MLLTKFVIKSTPDILFIVYSTMMVSQIKPELTYDPIHLFLFCIVVAVVINQGTLWGNVNRKITTRVLLSNVITMGSWGCIASMFFFWMLRETGEGFEYLVVVIVGILSYGGMKNITLVASLGEGLIKLMFNLLQKLIKGSIINLGKLLDQDESNES